MFQIITGHRYAKQITVGVSLFIAASAAAALAFSADTVPENTTYRVRWLEAFDQIAWTFVVGFILIDLTDAEAGLSINFPSRFGDGGAH